MECSTAPNICHSLWNGLGHCCCFVPTGHTAWPVVSTGSVSSPTLPSMFTPLYCTCGIAGLCSNLSKTSNFYLSKYNGSYCSTPLLVQIVYD